VWKWLLGIFLVLVVLCGGGGYFLATSPQFKDMRRGFTGQKKPVEVRLDKAARGNLTKTVSAPGTIEARTKVEISAQVSSKIIALPFKEGDDVKASDVVVRLDARDLIASLESAQAAKLGEEARLAGAKAALVQARSDRDRQRRLAETNDVSTAALEAAEAEFLRAESSVLASEHSVKIGEANIKRAERDVENAVITSPIDGTITKLNVEVGEQVLGTFNNAGTVMMEIADRSEMLMKARVDESNINPVKAGQSAKVYINSYGDRVFEGVVERVGIQKELDRDNTAYFMVEALVKTPADERLRTGLAANVDIAVETLYDVVKVPSQAVVDRRVDELPKELGDSQFIDRNKPFARVVFRLVEGKAKAVPVSVGASDLTHSIILGGLDAGEKIITGPFKVLVDLKDGREVVEEGTLPKDGKPAKDAKTLASGKP
jgi:HlyD family secretion protein